jgi:hypothetical protein
MKKDGPTLAPNDVTALAEKWAGGWHHDETNGTEKSVYRVDIGHTSTETGARIGNFLYSHIINGAGACLMTYKLNVSPTKNQEVVNYVATRQTKTFACANENMPTDSAGTLTEKNDFGEIFMTGNDAMDLGNDYPCLEIAIIDHGHASAVPGRCRLPQGKFVLPIGPEDIFPQRPRTATATVCSGTSSLVIQE